MFWCSAIDIKGYGCLGSTQAMLEGVLESVPIDNLAIHCHDTYGQALANILIALEVSASYISYVTL